ncbi:PKD domain-containing protein [Algisphaera agarilytica]|uniref:PKD domain-containing protein n=1 Tax=Algisphaera agarilytica TaxID=1385975 RepID=A0A7X0H5N4_9BACT|nr:PKD domain-containing protein [Algisphaera agarilytica]MBB6429517.1 hypothetical protein [Algisphaera agarilytica]
MQSSMEHQASGSTAVYSIDMPLAGPRGVEPRRPRDGKSVVLFVFDQAVASVGGMSSTHGTIGAASGVSGASADTVEIHLEGIPDGEWVTISLTDVVSPGGETQASVEGTLGFLMGDVTLNRVVNVSDIRKVATFSGQDVGTGNNFVQDLIINQAINVSDIRFTATRNGQSLPNTAPTLTGLADQSTTEGVAATQAFVVDDFTTPASGLTVSATSNNTTLLPQANIGFSGVGSSRDITATPVSGQTGSATVSVTVSDGSLSSTQTFVLTVGTNTLPEALAEADNFVGAAPLTVGFDGSRSSDDEGDIASYSWNFGDGSTSTAGPEVSHTYASAGTYEATLEVTDGGGATHSIPLTITVSDGSFDINATPSESDASRFL